MFLMHNKEARECRLHAEPCEDKAQRQSDPQNRADFLEMRQRWLGLARSYEFLERLELLSAVEANINDARLIIKDAAQLPCAVVASFSAEHHHRAHQGDVEFIVNVN